MRSVIARDYANEATRWQYAYDWLQTNAGETLEAFEKYLEEDFTSYSRRVREIQAIPSPFMLAALGPRCDVLDSDDATLRRRRFPATTTYFSARLWDDATLR